MKYGIFVDIHGNIEALEAVLDELDMEEVRKVLREKISEVFQVELIKE